MWIARRKLEEETMSKYIDALKLKYNLQELPFNENLLIDQVGSIMCDAFVQILDEIPGEDVEPVRHGKWEEKNTLVGEYMICSLCHFRLNSEHIYSLLNYCPNCGAKMNEG